MVGNWLRDRPPRPDPQGQARVEAAQDAVVAKVEAQAEQLLAQTMASQPDLAAKVDAVARRKKLEIERDLILGRHGYRR